MEYGDFKFLRFEPDGGPLLITGAGSAFSAGGEKRIPRFYAPGVGRP